MNRLDLDFKIDNIEERKQFVEKYLESPQFKSKPPTKKEIETISNYILWGKDKDGKNSVQRGDFEIETKNKTWSAQKEESLDALMEIPTFKEEKLQRNFVIPKIKKETFSRSEALKEAPSYLVEDFKALFRLIDETDLMINFYELAHNKREKIRSELLERFSKEELSTFKAKAEALGQFKYLKLRHHLVELRRQQYTLRDGFKEPINVMVTPVYHEEKELSFEEMVPVFPMGCVGESKQSKFVFRPLCELNPNSFGEKEIKQILEFYWSQANREFFRDSYFDFRETEHLYNLLLTMEELEEVGTSPLVETLRYYISITPLSQIHKDILQRKIRKEKNTDIAAEINKLYGKNYTPNYISTIFRQKIIEQIKETVLYHERIITSLSFPEEFKVCSHCGRTLLIDGINFVKKARSKDGFANRCKVCDKMERDKKK